jgi:hypothetical protein
MEIALAVGILVSGVLAFFCLKFVWFMITFLIKGKDGKR